MRIVVVVAVAVIAGAAGPARADHATGERLRDEASALADHQNFAGAAAKYREAYAADPLADYICDVGVAFYKAKELPRAQLYLGRCLELGARLDPTYLEKVGATLAQIERALVTSGFAPVAIEVEPPTATIAIGSFGPDDVVTGGRTVWMKIGGDSVTATAEGYQPMTQHVTPPADKRVDIKLARTPETPKLDTPKLDTTPIHVQQPPPPIVEHPIARDVPPSKLPLIAASSVVVASVIAAVIAHGQASDHADRAGLALRGDAFRDESSSVTRWNAVFGVGVGLAGLGAAAAGYLVISGRF